MDYHQKNAETKAPWSFAKNEQVFENYGQPNHIYFMYHGFILDENSHDCSLLETSIEPDDEGSDLEISELQKQLGESGFKSYSLSLCLTENSVDSNNENSINTNDSSIAKLGRFLAVKKQITEVSGNEIFEAVLDFFERKLKGYDIKFLLETEKKMKEGEREGLSYSEECMVNIALTEVRAFEGIVYHLKEKKKKKEKKKGEGEL
jgi:hypothetical protein